MSPTPEIWPENFWREVWHTNCPDWPTKGAQQHPSSGIMQRLNEYRQIEDGSTLRLFKCLHCGVKVFAGLDKGRRIVVQPEG